MKTLVDYLRTHHSVTFKKNDFRYEGFMELNNDPALPKKKTIYWLGRINLKATNLEPIPDKDFLVEYLTPNYWRASDLFFLRRIDGSIKASYPVLYQNTENILGVLKLLHGSCLTASMFFLFEESVDRYGRHCISLLLPKKPAQGIAIDLLSVERGIELVEEMFKNAKNDTQKITLVKHGEYQKEVRHTYLKPIVTMQVPERKSRMEIVFAASA